MFCFEQKKNSFICLYRIVWIILNIVQINIKVMMKLFDIMNDMKNMSKQQIEQYQKNGYENNLKATVMYIKIILVTPSIISRHSSRSPGNFSSKYLIRNSENWMCEFICIQRMLTYCLTFLRTTSHIYHPTKMSKIKYFI